MPLKETLSYLLSQISEMRAQITRLKGEPLEARAQIDSALKRLTGSNLDLLHALPAGQLLSLLTQGGRIDAEKGLFIAEMLRLEAALTEARPEAYEKALLLYLEAFEEEDELTAQYGGGLVEVVQALDASFLPSEVKRRAFDQLAASGTYTLAEDLLFCLLRDTHDHVLLERGRRFYLDLLRLSDDDLARGGLPRDEVEESLRELERL